MKIHGETETKLIDKTKGFTDRLRYKQTKNAFMTWIKALALSKALDTITEIQKKSL